MLVNDGGMLVNDGERLVNDGGMVVNDGEMSVCMYICMYHILISPSLTSI